MPSRGPSLKLLRLLPLAAAVTFTAFAQTHRAAPAADPNVLMLSDIHFDPFHDTAKLDQLRRAPVEQWPAILSAPASPSMAADFAKIQSTCRSKGIDTPFPLFDDSLMAAHNRQPRPLFITVSGDLMAHAFDCRFHLLAPQAPEAEYSVFAAKTVAFVALEIHRHFPTTPVYFALGNNDSGCSDYSETPGSAFLQADARTFADAALTPANRASILSTFSDLGDYTVQLPAPIEHGELIVLQDIFASKRHAACPGGKLDTTHPPAAAQIDWLRDQLTQARDRHQHVWVMAHIPPGIDPYATFKSNADVCAGKKPVLFLGSESLASTLADFPDVIRFALFAHTHMDEIRLIHGSSGDDLKAEAIPAKLVPSISPVDGNDPAFTVAQVEPATAIVKDYTVYAANSQAASAWMQPPSWREEYRYSTTYRLPDFSAASVTQLTDRFLADKTGTSPSALAYEHNYYVGQDNLAGIIKAAALQFVWPRYACAVANSTIAGYRTCSCPAKPSAP